MKIPEALRSLLIGVKAYTENIKADMQKHVEDKIIEYDNSRYPYEPLDDDIPRIYLYDGFLPTTKDYTLLKMKYESKTKSFECYVNMKCQGTSSMDYPKKNFSIRTYSDETLENKFKLDFKGWGEQHKFVLKANYIDLTHARNIVSARLWTNCVKTRSNFVELPEELKESPCLGAIDGFFVKVYHEGIYQGRYTFNIPKDPWMTNMDEDNEQHCLLCSENYVGGCFRQPALIDESDWTDEIHDVVPDSILTKWNEIIDFVRFSSNEDFISGLSNYFDVESLIDYYCFHYMICGLDAMGKNQVYITYDGNKWYATSYDMDSTWGLYWNGSRIVSTAYRMQTDYETAAAHGTSNLLYDRLEMLFKQEIYDRYQVLRQGPMSITNIISEFEDFVNVCNSEMVVEDCEVFPNIPGQEISNIKQIRNYAVARLNYVDDCIEELVSDLTANKIYQLNQSTTFNGTSTYVDTGIKLFDTVKDWTMIIHGYTNNLEQDTYSAIFHCITEENGFPGMSLVHNGQTGEDAGLMFSGSSSINYQIQKNNFKIALVCKDGIVSQLKLINDHGVENHKFVSGRYTQVNKNLILGAYLDESGNYGRYWNGTLYSFDIYDSALSGGEINIALKNLPLKTGYSPNGEAFSDSLSVDWQTQEIYVTMNLDTCTGTNENILSFGNDIGNWFANINCHMFYTASNDRLKVHFRLNDKMVEAPEITVTGNLTIVFNSDGLRVNNTDYLLSEYGYDLLYTLTNLSIGSTQGATRSKASNYVITVRRK